MAKKAKGALVDIRSNPRDNKNFRLVKELQKRADSLYRMVPYAAAEKVFEDLQACIPKKGPYKDLSKGLKLDEIGMYKKGIGGQGGYAVHVPTKSSKIKKTDASRTVIYIKVKKMQGAPDPALKILEDMGPWTMDTIPFWPDKGKATVTQRKVSARETKRVSVRQKKQKAKIRRDLTKTGKQLPAKDKLKVSSKNKAVPDVGMAALDLEFGSEGKRAKPLWRQSLRAIRGAGMARLAKSKQIRTTWFDGNTKAYKSFTPKSGTIGKSVVGKYKVFQKRLGYG